MLLGACAQSESEEPVLIETICREIPPETISGVDQLKGTGRTHQWSHTYPGYTVCTERVINRD
jgi:hypothetical protein